MTEIERLTLELNFLQAALNSKAAELDASRSYYSVGLAEDLRAVEQIVGAKV